MRLLLIAILSLVFISFYGLHSRDLSQDFKNRVEGSNEFCDNARGGIKYLRNTDTQHSYKVTVRERWTITPGSSGSIDEVIEMPAGGRTKLGCSSETFPQSRRTRIWTVVGEQQQ